MGYLYSFDGKLSCDSCGAAEGKTRKRRCPHGWCQAAAICAQCWSDTVKRARFKASHVENDCKGKSAEFHTREARREELEVAGTHVRCAAYDVGELGVHVLFCAKADVVGRYMPKEAYRAIPLGQIATIADYEAHGTLTEAPNGFAHMRALRAQQSEYAAAGAKQV